MPIRLRPAPYVYRLPALARVDGHCLLAPGKRADGELRATRALASALRLSRFHAEPILRVRLQVADAHAMCLLTPRSLGPLVQVFLVGSIKHNGACGTMCRPGHHDFGRAYILGKRAVRDVKTTLCAICRRGLEAAACQFAPVGRLHAH